MKTLKRYTIVLFLLPWTLIIGCGATLGINKSKTPAQNMRIAVADIASGLQQADKVTQQLYSQGVIDADEAKHIELFVRQGTVVNDQANACVDLVKSAVPGTAEAVTATACVNGVLTAFRTSEAQAVVGIKSIKAQSAFNASLSLFDGGVALMTRVLAEYH